MHKSFGSKRNYRVLKLGNMPKATVDIQPSDFRFGWGRNYMVLKLVLLPIHSLWSRKSYRVLKPGGWTTGLEEDKIAGFSNNASIRSKQSNALEAKELQGTQTAVCEAVRAILVWKGIELQGAQIPLRDESSQPSFESGSNYRVLKLDVWCAGLANWFEGNRITEFSNACYTLLHGVLRVWKKINYKDLKLTSVFAPEQLWFGKR